MLNHLENTPQPHPNMYDDRKQAKEKKRIINKYKTTRNTHLLHRLNNIRGRRTSMVKAATGKLELGILNLKCS